MVAAQPPTIYDVARVAGVSIASVSRVLNGQGNPRVETRQRVLEAVAELGFAPDGAARALSARLKEVVGIVVRLPRSHGASLFADEDKNLQFPDMINRGMGIVAQRHGFDLLIRSVDLDEPDVGRQVFALARKSDGLILHDRVPTETTVNVHGDNASGMRALAQHLIHNHGYRTIAYLAGHDGSPDSMARGQALADEVAAAGATLVTGEEWRGGYQAATGAQTMERLIASGAELPRAIVCANDQSAMGAAYALARHHIRVPHDVAITGFDDIPVSRHLHPQLTSVRHSIRDLGSTAFATLFAMITEPDGPDQRGKEIVLPCTVVRRESCGCKPEPMPLGFQAGPED
jgi:LacI family transcriptional regulator